jgi:hypothetical protein
MRKIHGWEMAKKVFWKRALWFDWENGKGKAHRVSSVGLHTRRRNA